MWAFTLGLKSFHPSQHIQGEPFGFHLYSIPFLFPSPAILSFSDQCGKVFGEVNVNKLACMLNLLCAVCC